MIVRDMCIIYFMNSMRSWERRGV